MLNTLMVLGYEIAQQQGEWDNLVEIPKKISEIDKNGNPVHNYVLIITFDIDSQQIVFKDGLQTFSKEISPTKYRNIKSEKWGRNGDPWAVTCSFPKKTEILQKSIFGKKGENIGCGLFQNSIGKKQPEIKKTLLYQALENCYSLKDIELSNNLKGIDALTSEYIKQQMKGRLSRNHKIVLISIAIKSELLGINSPKLLCELDGFDEFIKSQCNKVKKAKNENAEKLCYATGRLMSNIVPPDFSDRKDLNNIFVTTTINYANSFSKKQFTNNYQLGKDSRNALETASNYIRGQFNNHPCAVSIANINHFIIPTFLNYENLDLKFEIDRIEKMSEWLFSLNDMENLIEGIEGEKNENLFWINYIAYANERGNSVKVINHIKDVSSRWFYHIIHKDFEQSKLLANYFQQKATNLSTIYYAIPILKDHKQKNDALKLLSQILEQRKIPIQKLFKHFTELILCHYYDRYRFYSNITFKSENFDYAIKDSVVKYLFLINLLKSLNLTDMEENEKLSQESSETGEKLQQFFIDMGYSPQQKSLYWLGRIVWRVGKAQLDKGHKHMPVLNKVDYNGMSYSKIQRLFVDVFELATQYRISNEIKFPSSMFQQYFPASSILWKITPQEAVFFILSGFSLYINNN